MYAAQRHHMYHLTEASGTPETIDLHTRGLYNLHQSPSQADCDSVGAAGVMELTFWCSVAQNRLGSREVDGIETS